MTNEDVLKENVITLIKGNNITPLKEYINENDIVLKHFNSDNFDLLIYAIENNAKAEIINYIITEGDYKNLNYYIVEGFLKYKYPFFTALEKNNFEVADLLIKNEADVNYYRRDVVNHLNSKKLLNRKNLKYLLSHGFNVTFLTPNSIYNLISNSQNDLLEIIFKYYKYDNNCILNLLNLYKNNKSFKTTVKNSDDESFAKINKSRQYIKKELKEILRKEKSKITVDEIMYKKALENKNYDALKILFENDSSEERIILKRIIKYGLFEKAIETSNYSFVRKILSYDPFNYKTYNYESILADTYQKNIEIWKLLIQSYIYTSSDENGNEMSNYTMNKKYDVRYFNLLLNRAIRRKDHPLMTYLVEGEEFQSNLTIDAEDINGEYPVLTAFYSKELDTVKYLIDHGADVNSKNSHGMSLLLLAVYEENKEFVQYLLKKPNIMIYDKDINGNHPILQAIHQNDIEMVYLLLNYCTSHHISININEKDSSGSYPLMKAIYNKNIEIIKLLLNYAYTHGISININEKDKSGNLPLTKAIDQNSFNIAELLISYCHQNGIKIDVNEKDFNGHTPIMKAVKRNHTHITDLLIDYCIENGIYLKLNQLDENGNTVLIDAIERNNFDIVFSLVNYSNHLSKTRIGGVNHHINEAIDICDAYGSRPLILSYSKGYFEIFKYLVKYLGINSHSSRELLYIAIEKKDMEMVNFLLSTTINLSKNGLIKFENTANTIMEKAMTDYEIFMMILEHDRISLNLPGLFGDTLLARVIRYDGFTEQQKYDSVDKLIKKGANVNFVDGLGNSPLVYAIQYEYSSIIRLLIKNGADRTIRSLDDKSLLDSAILSGSYKKTKFLYQNGFTTYNIKNIKFDTFQGLILRNDLKLLKLIIENNPDIDINMKDGSGCTLLNYAILENRMDIIRYLIKAGADPYIKYNNIGNAFDVNEKNNEHSNTNTYHEINKILLKE